MKRWLILLLALYTVLPGYAEEVRVLLVGDIMLDWRMLPYLKEHGFDYPFANVRPYLESAHIVAGNLEMPIGTEGERAEGKSFAFLGQPPAARALAETGVSVVTLANNHIMDYGPVAFADTLKHLSKAGISYCGAGPNLMEARQPAIVEAEGQRFAFLGYSNTLPASFYAGDEQPGTVRGLAKHFRPDITEAVSDGNTVIPHSIGAGSIWTRRVITRLTSLIAVSERVPRLCSGIIPIFCKVSKSTREVSSLTA